MKAKEWAEILGRPGTDPADCLKGFVAEIGEIAAKRGNTRNAVEGAVREQRTKWRAVCSLVPSFTQEMFDAALEKLGPQFKEEEDRSRRVRAPHQSRTQQVEASVRDALNLRKEAVAGRKLAEGLPKYRPFALTTGSIPTRK